MSLEYNSSNPINMLVWSENNRSLNPGRTSSPPSTPSKKKSGMQIPSSPIHHFQPISACRVLIASSCRMWRAEEQRLCPLMRSWKASKTAFCTVNVVPKWVTSRAWNCCCIYFTWFILKQEYMSPVRTSRCSAENVKRYLSSFTSSVVFVLVLGNVGRKLMGKDPTRIIWDFPALSTAGIWAQWELETTQLNFIHLLRRWVCCSHCTNQHCRCRVSGWVSTRVITAKLCQAVSR